MNQADKKSRFQRLATLRTKNVLKALKVLGNCANKQAYSYTEREVSAIFNALDKQLRATKSKFASTDERVDFKL